ncbi:hypothetical protein KJ359_000728 [Pestalotiopsis sp. 9143b]|nr:hypothetical protein KJ359_000728 [Pestalotiopsis sp. 9143b]
MSVSTNMGEFGWTEFDDEVMHEIGDSIDGVSDPGATIMWFGDHEGARLDELTEPYRRELEHKSPLSATIWFGKYKGHELRILYTRPRRWDWLIKNCGKWRRALLDMVRRYKIWREIHDPDWRMRRRQPRQSTQGRIVINKVGRSLGPWDEKSLSDADEDYDSDDGFVVADSETDTDADQDQDQSSTEDSVFEQMSDGEESEVLDDGDYDVVQQSSMVVGFMPSDDEATPQKNSEDIGRQTINLMNGSDDGSDSDLPTLETTFRTPRKRRLVRRQAVDSDADTPTRRSNTWGSDNEDDVSSTPTQTHVVITSGSEGDATSGREDGDEDDEDEDEVHFSQARNPFFDYEAKGGREGRTGQRSPKKARAGKKRPGDSDDDTASSSPARPTPRLRSRTIPALPYDASSGDEVISSPTRRTRSPIKSRQSPTRVARGEATPTKPRRRLVRGSPSKNRVSPTKESSTKKPISLVTSDEDKKPEVIDLLTSGDDEPVRSALESRHSKISSSQRKVPTPDPYDLPVYLEGLQHAAASAGHTADLMSLDSDDKPITPRPSPQKQVSWSQGHIMSEEGDSGDEPIRPPPSRRRSQRGAYIDSDDEPITPRRPRNAGR